MICPVAMALGYTLFRFPFPWTVYKYQGEAGGFTLVFSYSIWNGLRNILRNIQEDKMQLFGLACLIEYSVIPVSSLSLCPSFTLASAPIQVMLVMWVELSVISCALLQTARVGTT